MTKLTDPAVATAATLEPTDELYAVRPTDTTDDPAGSQYSATVTVVRTDQKAHVQIANVAALATLTGYVDGDVVEVKGYAATEGVGGGPFYLDTSGALGAAAQNAGTIFAADASFPANSYWRRKMDNTLVYTPEMFGGLSDDTAEAATAIQAVFDAMDVLNTPTVVQPTVEFTEGIAYKVTTPVTCKEDINIKMTTPIKYYGSESTGALVVGTTAVENKNVTLDILVERATVSDWTSEGSIGAKLFNNRSSKISIGATGFTIGLQCMARGLRFADNVIRVGKLTDNKWGMDFTNETDGVAGACQDNIVEGGYVSVGTGVRSAIARYGVRLVSLDVSASINVRNTFLATSFELDFATSTPADAIPFFVEDGNQNDTISCLHKTNSPDFAVCKNFSTGNVFGHTGTSGTVDEQDSAVDNQLRFLGNERDNGPFRQIFDSGPMQKTACLYSATLTHIPRVNLTTSATGTNAITQSSVTTFVEPNFTADFTTDEIIHTAHSRINGDVVYLSTSVADLPNPLAIDTRYYVVGATVNRFQLSTQLGGGPVTLTDNGTGTHVYHSPHRYVEMDSTRALGVTVDTAVAKQFSVVNDFEKNFGGRVRVRAFDVDGNILTDNPSPAHVIGSGTTFDWTPGTYGGHYTSSSDIVGEVFFRVGTAVKSIDVLMSGGSSVIRIRRFSLHTIEVDVAPTVSIIYDEGPVGTNWGTFAPTLGVWEAGRTIKNVSTSETNVRQWVNRTSGSPGTWERETGPTTITPQMYGGVGDNSTDDSTAVQAAADACDDLNSPTVTKPTLHFPHAIGYRCNSTITVKENIHVTMDAPLVHNGSQSTAGLVIGTAGTINRDVDLRLRVSRVTTSDWTNEGSTGVRLINADSSDIFVNIGTEASVGGFTIGCELIGHAIDANARGATANNVYVGILQNNRYAFNFTNQSDGAGNGFCNENKMYGGNIVVNSGIASARSVTEVHAFRITSVDQNYTGNNHNVWWSPSVEMKSEGLPFQIVHGQLNSFFSVRDEGNSVIFARVLHHGANANRGNMFEAGRGTAGTLVQQGNAYDNVLRLSSELSSYSPMRLVFDSGSIYENAVAYDGTLTHVPNCHVSHTSNAYSEIAQADLTLSVSEVCTFDDTDDEVDEVGHTRVDGDIVFFTTTGTLPAGLSLATAYYVLNSIVDHFQVSTALNGSPVTDFSGGSGTHTYHSRNRYLAVANGRAVGIRIDTTDAQNFVVERDTDAIEAARPGRVHLRVFNADGTLLKNQEDFTVDDANNELIADHTLIVDDRITLTTTDTLPGTLATSTDYYVISINDTAAGRFRVSLTEGGSAVTDLSGGTGTHTYHLSYPYAATQAGSVWNENAYGGAYLHGSDQGGEFSFRVRDEVASVDVMCAGGSNPMHLRRFKVYTTKRDSSPRTWTPTGSNQTPYESSPARTLVSQAPTFGVYFTPLTVWEDTPASAAPPGWVLTVSGAPGTFNAMANLV